MTEEERIEQAGAAMMRRLMGRGARPGMVDIAGIRDAGSLAAAGLGLARSPLAQRLAARRTGDGAMAVTGGALVHPLRRTVGSDTTGEEGETPSSPVAEMSMAPRARSAPARGHGAAASAPPAPSQPVETPSGSDTPSSVVAPSTAAASPSAARMPGSPAGGRLASNPGAAAPQADVPDGPALVPQVRAAATGDADAATPDMPLALARRAGAAAGALAPASETTAIAAEVMPASASAFGMEGMRSAMPLGASTGTGGFGRATSGEPLADLTEQVQRDLHRRLAVERERQGLARWRR